MVETPEQAIRLFMAADDVDVLLLEDQLLYRRSELSLADLRLAPDSIVTLLGAGRLRRVLVLRGETSMEISTATLRSLEAPCGTLEHEQEQAVREELERVLRLGILVTAVAPA